MTLLTKGPAWGATRFRCECGQRIEDGGTAVMHAFQGHTPVREKFAGRWVIDVNISQFIEASLRKGGETRDQFIRRLNTRIEQLKRAEEDTDGA